MKTSKPFAMFCLLLAAIFSAGCNKESTQDDTPKAEYTVIYYRSAALGLSYHHDAILQDMITIGSTERVNVVAEVKHGRDYQNEPGKDGTQRLVIEKGNLRLVEKKSADYPMHRPENIAEFITWAKTNFPAKKYIFVTSGHGSGWTAEHDTPPTKGLNPDDNIEGTPYITIGDLAEGIRLSDTHFEMMFFNNCLMLAAEVLAEIQPHTRYVMGSAHEIWLPGTSFSYFLRQLNKPMKLTEAMKPFIDQTVYTWSVNMAIKADVDMQLLDLDRLDPLLDNIKQIVQQFQLLNKHYAWECSVATESTYRLDETWPLFDLRHYVFRVAKLTKYEHEPLITYYQLDAALRDMVVYKQERTSDNKQTSIGINVVDQKRYAEEYLAGRQPYNTLRFHKLTGWGDWLSSITSYPAE